MTFVLTIPDEMRHKYIDRRAQDLGSLQGALEKNDFEVFSKVGHQLRGNAATFGYDSLGVLGEKLEKVAESHDTAEAEACLSALRSWIAQQKAPK